MGNDKRERKAKRTRKNKTVIQSITIQIQFKSFITISIPPFPSFLKTRILFIIISPFPFFNQSFPSNTTSLHSLSHTGYLGSVLHCEWDWCSIIFTLPSHTIHIIHNHKQWGVSHHSYTCGHGDTPIHVNMLETLTQ